MEMMRFSETSVDIYQTKWRYISEDRTLKTQSDAHIIFQTNKCSPNVGREANMAPKSDI
jgi:hypothetical protein